MLQDLAVSIWRISPSSLMILSMSRRAMRTPFEMTDTSLSARH